jgi:hypothetical protein
MILLWASGVSDFLVLYFGPSLSFRLRANIGLRLILF